MSALERAKHLFSHMRQRADANITQSEAPTLGTLGDQLTEAKTPFPWGLLTSDERAQIERQRRGVLSATSGAVYLGPWQTLSNERAMELRAEAAGIMSVTSGGAAFGDLFNSQGQPRPETKGKRG